MKQKIIVATSIWDFRTDVQEYLDDGWRVVPGTTASTLFDLERGHMQERHIVFLEKP